MNAFRTYKAIPPITVARAPLPSSKAGRLFLATLLGVCLCAVCAPVGEAKAATPAELEFRAAAGEDATPGVRAILDRCREEGIHRLKIAPGRYDFWPDWAVEKYLFVSNNGEGLKRIAFPLVGFDGLEIDGSGATFVFHGFLVPFLVESSHNVRIKNLSIDFARPFHSEGKVLAATPESVDVEISEEFPYSIRNGMLVFTDGKTAVNPESAVKKPAEVLYPYGSLLAFDPVRRETAYMAKDRYGVSTGIPAGEIGKRQMRLSISKVTAEAGNILVFGAAMRSVPGFILSETAQTSLENVTIHHCGGMGVIAQLSSDIELNGVKVTPPPGGRRIVSITADATHFVNCTGKIVMRNCLFENQKDDATNVHGLYAPILRILGPDKFEIRMANSDQAGLDFIRAGARLEVVDGPSLVTHGEMVVSAVKRLNKEISVITAKTSLPLKKGDCVANLDANTAEVLIKDCVFRGNRARGLLLGSRGKMTIEGNTFHIPGSALLFEGDACGWFEQSGVRDVTIRNNTFDNCNFGVWGKACIEVGSGIRKDVRHTSRYNKNITIENNVFRVFGNRSILNIYSVDGLTFRNNQLERTAAYPAIPGPAEELYQVVDSDNIAIEPAREITPRAVAGADK